MTLPNICQVELKSLRTGEVQAADVLITPVVALNGTAMIRPEELSLM
jgi:hypothetical protein